MRHRLLRIQNVRIMWFFLLLLAYSGHNLFAQKYIWPTDASHAMTSSFAEYRPGRFHAAIDIKTWGQVGYKIFAVRPGYISRIRVSPYGYGRAIYLTLDTGETIVYGHLLKFADPIEKYVEAEQEKRGRYSLQLYPRANQFRVNTGDVLGYTGQTGVGYPHLHFEMRDQYNRPFNPFLRGYRVEDTVAPVISKVAIKPLDAFSTVNGDWQPVIFRTIRIRTAHYKLPEIVQVSGRIAFAVSAYDQMNGITNRYGIYINRLFIDDQLIFQARYDRFSYSENNQANLDRDFRLYVHGKGLFYNLFRDQGNRLSFYLKREPYYGVISFDGNGNRQVQQDSDAGLFPQRFPAIVTLPQGFHSLTIETEDFWGNKSVVKGQLYASERCRPSIDLVDTGNDGILLGKIKVDDPQRIARYSVFLSGDHGRTWRAYMQQETEISEISDTQEKGGATNDFSFQLPNISVQGHSALVKVVTRDTAGFVSFPAYFLLSQQDQTEADSVVAINADFYDHYVRIELKLPSPGNEIVKVEGHYGNGNAGPVTIVQTDPVTYVGALPITDKDAGPLTLEIYSAAIDGRENVRQVTIPFTIVHKGERKIVQTEDGLCSVDFSANSLFKDIYLRSEIIDSIPTNKYDIVSSLYKIEPADVPLNKGATILIKYPAQDTLPEKLGIYYKAKNKWQFLANRFVGDHIRGHVSSFGTYCLIRDVEPPLIYSLYPSQCAHLTKTKPTLKARFEDKLSGIRGEENMVMKLDGRKVIAEYDPEQNILFYRVRKPLARGKHTLELTVIDRCGNKTERTHTFWID